MNNEHYEEAELNMIKGVPPLPPTRPDPPPPTLGELQKLQKNDAKKVEQKWRHKARKVGA